MKETTKEHGDILRELAPHLEIMEEWYDRILQMQLLDGKNEEDASGPASVMAVMLGLSLSRNTKQVTEKVENITFAQEIFRIMVGVKKLIKLGLVEGNVEGTDEFGWPQYHITGINKEEQ